MVTTSPIKKLYDTNYVPNEPPSDASQLQRYLKEEFERIAAVLKVRQTLYLYPMLEAPERPVEGMVVRALAGVYWDPGSGEGVYYYTSMGLWAQLG